MSAYAPLLEPVIAIARRAGAAILAVYNRPEGFAVTGKADDSPLTEADIASHRIIVDGLARLTPDLPLLSEESGEQAGWETRRHWSRYWLVDPLDGTKEFVKRSGDFTVNIALVENGVPVFGVVYVPVGDTLYAGHAGGTPTAFREDGTGRRPIRVRTQVERVARGEPLTVVASKSHAGERLPALLTRLEREFGSCRLTSIGSSLKICLVAEGRADLYPRLGPTSEWDTAAAQAVLQAAGGAMVGPDLAPLRCNRGESLLNPDFHALGDPAYRWEFLREFSLAG
ncbi:MAG: 3'(2'),5'-bisphosphate nucleotidase CysQ [Pseudomonadota bacterium]